MVGVTLNAIGARAPIFRCNVGSSLTHPVKAAPPTGSLWTLLSCPSCYSFEPLAAKRNFLFGLHGLVVEPWDLTNGRGWSPTRTNICFAISLILNKCLLRRFLSTFCVNKAFLVAYKTLYIEGTVYRYVVAGRTYTYMRNGMSEGALSRFSDRKRAHDHWWSGFGSLLQDIELLKVLLRSLEG